MKIYVSRCSIFKVIVFLLTICWNFTRGFGDPILPGNVFPNFRREGPWYFFQNPKSGVHYVLKSQGVGMYFIFWTNYIFCYPFLKFYWRGGIFTPPPPLGSSILVLNVSHLKTFPPFAQMWKQKRKLR